MIYAIVENGLVIDLAEWDGETDWKPDTGEAVKSDSPVGIGWNYGGDTFSPPSVPEPSQAELVVSAEMEKSSRLGLATSAIVVWQTKLLMGRTLTADETTQLNAWMDYIDAVTAVDALRAPNITWPTVPVA